MAKSGSYGGKGKGRTYSKTTRTAAARRALTTPQRSASRSRSVGSKKDWADSGF